MEELDPGHKYALRILDSEKMEQHQLVFVKREGEGYPGNVGHHSGTTTQEVLRALIARTQYVNKQIPDWRNGIVLNDLRSAIYHLELRAAERHGRSEEFRAHFFKNVIEVYPTCEKCNHVGCPGTCH